MVLKESKCQVAQRDQRNLDYQQNKILSQKQISQDSITQHDRKIMAISL